MTTFTTGLDYMRFQEKRLDELIRDNKPLQVAAVETHRAMVKRIFEQEKDTDGSEIREPSTTPIYVNPSNSPKRFTTGGLRKKKRGEDKAKTKYFSGGYAEFKKTIDRPKLVLFGTMRNDFKTGIKRLNQSTWISFFKNPLNAKKAESLEARYQRSEIFAPSKKERDLFKKLLVTDTMKFLKGDKDD